MPTPVASDAKETSITYTIGEDQYIAIPESSIKKDLAKDFIKLMVSDYGCGVFLNEAQPQISIKLERYSIFVEFFISEVPLTVG